MASRKRTRRGPPRNVPNARSPATVGPVAGASSNHDGRNHQPKRRRTWKPLNLLAYGAVAVAGVAALVLLVRASGPSPTPVSGSDFRIVAYQGDELLGGHESVFSHVTRQGKPVVLNFFAGQCPPCRAEMPGFQRVADEFQGRVIFVGIDIGPQVQLGSHQDARILLSDLKMRYPAAYAVDSTPLTVYGVQGMPTTVIFDGRGQVVETHTGIFTEGQLRQKLAALDGR